MYFASHTFMDSGCKEGKGKGKWWKEKRGTEVSQAVEKKDKVVKEVKEERERVKVRIGEKVERGEFEVVKEDPYVLARTIYGIGFRTADAIAEKLGIPRNSIQRARAAIVFLLERMADDGHVYAPFEYLEQQFVAKMNRFITLWKALADEYNTKSAFNLKLAGEVTKAFHELENGEGWPKHRR